MIIGDEVRGSIPDHKSEFEIHTELDIAIDTATKF